MILELELFATHQVTKLFREGILKKTLVILIRQYRPVVSWKEHDKS
jgi:hypothetical protein